MAKTVATPHKSYTEKEQLWVRARAVCGGERQVKEHDLIVQNVENFLVPFSPTMRQDQYIFLKREAELPGITATFSRMLVGGLLRKEPELKLPKDAPEEALDWIKNQFSVDDSSLYTFLDVLLWEEIQTSRPWVFVDYPAPKLDADGREIDDAEARLPYALSYKAEQVINWRVGRAEDSNKEQLTLVVVKVVHEEDDPESEFHVRCSERYQTHDIFTGEYRVREWWYDKRKREWFQEGSDYYPVMNDKRLDYIPGWPANGQIEPIDPILTAIIDKEVALYNKIARRNHLLYGAATYTPVLKSDMDEAEFKKIANNGLGTWVQIGKDDELDTLKTPTDALQDLDRAIASAIEEIARLGVRMLAPENADQSGVALHLRNAAQNAQLGTLNSRVSNVMQQVIALMLNWRYDKEYEAKDITFNLSDDFSQTPLGEGWVRLATEWYETGKIPRSVWLIICKNNDIIPPDYDDEEGREEIQKEQDEFESKELQSYSDRLEVEQNAGGDSQ